MKVNEVNAKALNDVLLERQVQDNKWGVQNHDPFLYLAILTEEVGELSQAALQARFEGGDPDRMREEAVQVAAVALAIVECFDRDEWEWPVAPSAFPKVMDVPGEVDTMLKQLPISERTLTIEEIEKHPNLVDELTKEVLGVLREDPHELDQFRRAMDMVNAGLIEHSASIIEEAIAGVLTEHPKVFEAMTEAFKRSDKTLSDEANANV